VTKSRTNKIDTNHFTASMQTEASQLVIATPVQGSRLRDTGVASKFGFRQGLWIEDLQIPPGQECSNGSLILLAVVLWRTFFSELFLELNVSTSGETFENENRPIRRYRRKGRFTRTVHSLAEAHC
jgi:hypothetical protein